MARYALDTWSLHKLGFNEVYAATDYGSQIPSYFIWLSLRLCPFVLNTREPPLFMHWSARLNTWAGNLCSWFMAHVQVFQWSQIWYRQPLPTCASSIIMFQLISRNMLMTEWRHGLWRWSFMMKVRGSRFTFALIKIFLTTLARFARRELSSVITAMLKNAY